MLKFLLATNNVHKAQEFRKILNPLGIEIVTPKDLGLSIDPEENGKTFRQNSLIKAKAFFEASGLTTIADDSGLCIEALNGKPGIYSARFATESGGYPAVFDVLNKELEGKKRDAKFHCCICLYDGSKPLYFEGDCPGYLLDKPVGQCGFGYDPIFHCNEGNVDFGTAPEDVKNKYSHRSKALKQFVSYLNNR